MSRLTTALALALTAAGIAAGPAAASQRAALYVQTDDPAGNAVVAYDHNLKPLGTFKTGGNGGVLAGSVVDHLASQGSLTLDRGLLYAVNAGSNTITTFATDGDRVSRRQTLPSGGNFPVSVATHGNFVYVLNARDGGSLQGYLRVADFLIPTWHRALNLDTTQTPEFTHTPGQVAFTPNGDQLIVTTKAASNAVEVFDVNLLGGIERNPTINTLDGTVPFAVAFDQRGRLNLTEAGPSVVASFDLNRRGELGNALSSIPTTQAATCWITASGRFLFASNAGSATVTTVRPDGSHRPDRHARRHRRRVGVQRRPHALRPDRRDRHRRRLSHQQRRQPHADRAASSCRTRSAGRASPQAENFLMSIASEPSAPLSGVLRLEPKTPPMNQNMTIGSISNTSSAAGVQSTNNRHHKQMSMDNTAEALGLSTDDLKTQLKSGKTLNDIAKAQGVSSDDLTAALKKDLTANKPANAPELSDDQLTEMATNIAAGKGPKGPHGHGGHGGPPPAKSDDDTATNNLNSLASSLGVSASDLLEKLTSGTAFTATSNTASTNPYTAGTLNVSGGVMIDQYA